MTTETDSIRHDLAFLKSLAERGAHSDAKSGGLLIGVGVLFGLASLIHWVDQNHLAPMPTLAVAAGWTGATILFAMLSWLLNLKGPRLSAPDKRYSAARFGGGAAVLVLWIISLSAVWRFNNPDIIEIMAPLTFAFAGWFWAMFVSAPARKSLRWVPIGAFGAAITLSAFLGTPHLYLVNAIALFVLFVVPGILLRWPSKSARDA